MHVSDDTGGQITLDDLLLARAAGHLSTPIAVLIDAHLQLSPESLELYRRYVTLGGVLLEEMEGEPVAEMTWQRILDRLDDLPLPADGPPADAGIRQPARVPSADADLPPAVVRQLPAGGLEGLSWRRMRNFAAAQMPLAGSMADTGVSLRLVKVLAGATIPRHTHTGPEITLVLRGGFTDETGHYRRGAIAIADASIDHQPIADADEECVCLVANVGRLKFTSPLGRLLNPFLGA